MSLAGKHKSWCLRGRKQSQGGGVPDAPLMIHVNPEAYWVRGGAYGFSQLLVNTFRPGSAAGLLLEPVWLTSFHPFSSSPGHDRGRQMWFLDDQ